MTIVPENPLDGVARPAGGPAGGGQAFREAAGSIATRAKQALPASHGRIDKAVALVLRGDVELLPDGTARVASQGNGSQHYLVINGHCPCSDYPKAPEHLCKHRLGAAIARRTRDLVKQAVSAPPAVPPSQATPGTIPAEFVVTIHGRDFVQFAGLLAMAHAQGLVSLKAELISVSSDLALAQATATFADGRTFTEGADATPDNVNAGVKKHFLRVALTRAKARALRDALNIAAVAVEELGD